MIKKIMILVAAIVFYSSIAIASTSNAPGTSVQEEDGSPAGRFQTIKYSNGSLTDNGDGTVSISASGGTVDKITEGNTTVETVDAGDGYIVTTEDATEVMRVTGTNVGIGTIAPSAKLGVKGDLSVTGYATVSKQITLTDDLTVDTNTLKVDASTNRVGIGTIAPAKTLGVHGDLSCDGTSYLTAVQVGADNADAVIAGNGTADHVVLNDNVDINGDLSASGYGEITFWQDMPISVDVSRFTVNNTRHDRLTGGLLKSAFYFDDAQLSWNITPDGTISIELYEDTTLVKELTVGTGLRTGYVKDVNTTFEAGHFWSIRLNTLGDATNDDDPTKTGTLHIKGKQVGAN